MILSNLCIFNAYKPYIHPISLLCCFSRLHEQLSKSFHFELNFAKILLKYVKSSVLSEKVNLNCEQHGMTPILLFRVFDRAAHFFQQPAGAAI